MKLIGALFFVAVVISVCFALRPKRELPPTSVWIAAHPEFSGNTYNAKEDVSYCLAVERSGRIEPVKACVDRVWLAQPMRRCDVQIAADVVLSELTASEIGRNLANLHALGCHDLVLDWNFTNLAWMTEVLKTLRHEAAHAYLIVNPQGLVGADRKAICELADEVLITKRDQIPSVFQDCGDVAIRLTIVGGANQRALHADEIEESRRLGVSRVLIGTAR